MIVTNTFKNRIKGSLFGFVIGDAMGATTEFMAPHEIQQTYGTVDRIVGGGWLKLEPGEVTDDTQMTLCVMDALMKCDNTQVDFEQILAQNFIEWLETKPKDVGGQCLRGITSLMHGKKIGIDEQALGNGSLMRAMPCALLDYKVCNHVQSKLTHNNYKVDVAIDIYHNNINRALRGQPFSLVDGHMNPTGHVYNTLNNALYWANQNGFRKAIIGAVNDGGDADTIAAITGSLAGAKYGYQAIPQIWIDSINLEVKEKILKFFEFVVDKRE